MITGLAEQINLLFPDAAIDASIHYLNQQKNREKEISYYRDDVK